jgi:hypothetical protein
MNYQVVATTTAGMPLEGIKVTHEQLEHCQTHGVQCIEPDHTTHTGSGGIVIIGLAQDAPHWFRDKSGT